MLVLLAQMPSMVAAGWAGTNSESWTTVPDPLSVSSSAALPLATPPRKTQFLNVTFLPVTFTKPWKSLPLTTAPLVPKVWLPLTTASAVPATGPVLPAPGLPPRGAGAGAGPLDADLDGDAEAEADADGEGEGSRPEAEGRGSSGTWKEALRGDAAHAATAESNAVLTRRTAEYRKERRIIVLSRARGSCAVEEQSVDHTPLSQQYQPHRRSVLTSSFPLGNEGGVRNPSLLAVVYRWLHRVAPSVLRASAGVVHACSRHRPRGLPRQRAGTPFPSRWPRGGRSRHRPVRRLRDRPGAGAGTGIARRPAGRHRAAPQGGRAGRRRAPRRAVQRPAGQPRPEPD